MLARPATLLALAAMVTACGGDKAATVAPPDDQAAIARLHDDYTTHFNLHHATAVAALMTDSAVFLGADGSIDVNRAAIVAGLEQTMAASPTLTLSPAETMVLGDVAVTRGAYTLAMKPAGGEAISLSGSYMTRFERADSGWKIGAVLTNYDAPPPAGLPRDTTTMDPPPDAGTMTALVSGFAQHYNMGHANVVAGLFTDSAVAAFGDAPVSRGRGAIESYLAAEMAQGSPQLTVHDVATEILPGGWALDGGWWEVKAKGPAGAAMNRSGTYMLVAREQADKTWKIHWFAANGGPAPASAQ